RTNARVLKVNLDAAKNRAESVTYIDASGREFEQPGGIVILAAYALGNVHLMLWSGIGRPYDPVTGEGVVGRNYAGATWRWLPWDHEPLSSPSPVTGGRPFRPI